MGMSRRSLHRILHDDLKLHPYKIMIVQQLNEGDFVQRREFCRIMDETFTEDPDATVFMSDEAYFHLDGYTSMFKTVGIGHLRTHNSYTKDFCTV